MSEIRYGKRGPGWPVDMVALFKSARIRSNTSMAPLLAVAHVLTQHGYHTRFIKQPAIYWENGERKECNFYAIERDNQLITLDGKTSWEGVATSFCADRGLDPTDPLSFRLRDELTHKRTGQKLRQLLEDQDRYNLTPRVERAFCLALSSVMDEKLPPAIAPSRPRVRL